MDGFTNTIMRNLLDSPSVAWRLTRYDQKQKKLIFSKLTKIQLKGHVKNQPLGIIGTFLFWCRILFLRLSFDLIHKAWLWFTFGSLSKNKTLPPLKIFFLKLNISPESSSKRVSERGFFPRGWETTLTQI